jgi:hypothetical protein
VIQLEIITMMLSCIKRAVTFLAFILVSNSAFAVSCADLDGATVRGADQQYLGFFGSNFASDSINNQFGSYGSSFSSTSVRNQFGTYGGQFGSLSARNNFTSTPPLISKRGVPIAYLTTNPSLTGGISLSTIDAQCIFFSSSPSSIELPPAGALSCSNISSAAVIGANQQYLGFFGSNFATDSINNQFGSYGSSFSSTSVRNEFGTYGSPFSSLSAFNNFTSTPPMIFNAGYPVAYLTTNSSLVRRFSLPQVDSTCSFSGSSPSPFSPQAPFPVTNLNASKGDFANSISLSWNRSYGATKYNIYYSISENSGLIFLGSTPNLTFLATGAAPGQTYYFWVGPSNFFGLSGTSATDSGYASGPVIPNTPPVVSIVGGDRTIEDTDGLPGESVQLVATAVDSDGTVTSSEWLIADTVVATGLNATLALQDGQTLLTFRATDNDGAFASVSATITVQGPVIPNTPPVVSIVGGDRTIEDTDGLPGESVQLVATAVDSDGTVTSSEWLIADTVVATGLNATLALQDGQTLVTFKATDNEGASAAVSVTITVQAVVPIDHGPWQGYYNGVQPNRSLGLPFNNIGVIEIETMRIFSCVRFLADGSPSELDGVERMDILFNIVSINESLIQLIQVTEARPQNVLEVENQYGILPDCSGEFEFTNGQYSDFIQLGDDTFRALFQLIDDAALLFQVVEFELLTDAFDPPWLAPYSGITPLPSLGLSYNNIGIVDTDTNRIYSCVRFVEQGNQSLLDGFERLDIVFDVVSLDHWEMRVLEVRPFNPYELLNEYGQLPDCSGEFEFTNSRFSDTIQLGDTIYQKVFELIDGDQLLFREIISD